MSAFPFMPLYVGDYLADTAHLSTEESGAYLLLIMTYWQRGKALPADPSRLANIARMSSERWTSVEQTLSEFFDVVDGEWRHKRIEAELAKVRDKAEKAKAAGKASAKSRKSTPEQPLPNGRSTDAQRTLNQSESESEPDLELSVCPSPDPARTSDGQTDPNYEKCKLAFNGSTGRIVDEVRNAEGPYGTKARAAEWLADTIDDFGGPAVLDAFRFLEKCRGEGQTIRDPRGFISKNAQRHVENQTAKAAQAAKPKRRPIGIRPVSGEIIYAAE